MNFIKYCGLMLVCGTLLSACQAPPKIAPSPILAEKPPAAAPTFMVSKWEMLPDWSTLNLTPSWPALQQSCRALRFKPKWQPLCAAAEKVDSADAAAQRAFYETWFTPYQVFNPDGSEQGLITGYYEPLLKGSRSMSERFRFPLYGAPEDLLEVDLGDVYPQFKGMRLRGRLHGKKIIPYYNRAEIDAGVSMLKGRELFWVENAVELFFLQIQGSGRIELEDGRRVKIGYAEQNGHPYISIGKKLIEMGELKPEEASMQGIKNWAEHNPERLPALLGQNPSYVFFRELPDTLSAPLGALGVPLTNEYSIAVDPRTVPLGVPVFLSTTLPDSAEPLNRLMYAQDTGGAIKGAVRADFFWGFGELAGIQAGRMRQAGRMWVLFPRGTEPTLN
ncbi:MAG: membrane-bound lytic murein transglycosylase [Gallionellaceae bacterium]|nr:MAG: membrane-bound lytic murein transglycosylase [Gallionellaceae bacterium]